MTTNDGSGNESYRSVNKTARLLRGLARSSPETARQIAELLLKWSRTAPTYTGRTWAAERTSMWGSARSAGIAPPNKTPVVYFLIDEGEVTYVGSSNNFADRMFLNNGPTAHVYKRFDRFEARECRSRPDAYDLERREIWERRPRDNGEIRNSLPGPADYLRALLHLDEQEGG